MKKRLSLMLLSGALLLGGAALTSCGGGDNPTDVPGPDNPDNPKPETYAYVFTGSLELTSKTYNVKLNCKEDKTFTLVIEGNDKTVKGTYTFADGIGFTFKFNDQTSTEVTTKFNTETKEHYFSYEIKLGEEGKGTVEFKLKDENFVPTVSSDAKINFIKRANFTASFMGAPTDPTKPQTAPTYAETLSLELDGTCKITHDTALQLEETAGTYVFENNTFTFTFGDKTYSTTFNLGTAEYSFKYVLNHDSKDVNLNFKWNSTQKGLSTRINVLGGVTCDVYLYGNKTALFDITCDTPPTPFMQIMFDKTAEWTYNSTTHVYKFTFENPEGEPLVLETTYDPETKESSLKYSIQGEQTIDFDLKGQLNDYFSLKSTFATPYGECQCEFNFLDDTKVFRDITGAGPAATMFDGEGTYTFANNEIKVVLPDLKNVNHEFTSVWDEQKGTYTINYNLEGTEIEIKPVMVANVW